MDRARSRVSAYVYGNILVLAAVTEADSATILSWTALIVVAGTTITTFLAHIFAHMIGQQLGRTDDDSRAHVRDEVRDSVPIVSAGSVPALMMLLSAAHVLPPLWAQLIASAIVVGRLALMGFMIGRLTSRKSTLGMLWSGVVVAGLSAVIVGAKILVNL